LHEAEHWRQAQGLSVDDSLSYLREFEHMTLVRLLIARYKRHHVEHAILDALGLLERLLHAAETSGRMGSVIELLVLQALAREAQRHTSLALAALRKALTLAEPEGYIRIFVDEGPRMARLLSEAAGQNISHDYVGRLLAAFEASQQKIKTVSERSSSSSWARIQPLTRREREVLQLLVAGHSNPEIAVQLFIAVTTVKTHLKNIFEKLEVTNRVQAVARTKELDLL
jgi:LuxR family maltose regulon positive regulatory protein